MAANFETDVLVVGAGLSGLTAAYHLEKAGKNVIVLEARERIGGRIYSFTTEDGRGAFDLGPTWFWGHHQYVIDFIKQFDLNIFEQYETGYHLFQQQGSAPERFVQQSQNPTSYRIAGGTIQLVNALAEHIDPYSVRLNHVVQAISQQADDSLVIQVLAGEETIIWHAQQVIVTLPPHLAATTIDYRPALDAHVRETMITTPTWMGEAMKVSLVYDRPFWREQNLSGMAVSYFGAVQQWQDATPAEGQPAALFGWIGNNSPSRNLSLVDRRAAVIQQAIDLFGDDAAHPIHYEEVNWEHEAFTTNAEDTSRVIAAQHPTYGHPLLQQPQMRGRLWWAVTEVSPVSGGYLDGALYIGQAIAQRITEATTA